MTDGLELELRQLAGVLFVSFSEDEAGAHVEIVADPSADRARILKEATVSVSSHLDGLAEVRIYPAPGGGPAACQTGGRVRLDLAPAAGNGATVEVRLSRGKDRSLIKAVASDTAAVGRAVLEALRGLGAFVPYDLVGIYALPSGWGAGLVAVLRNTNTGVLQRGVASGGVPAEAAARAVLNALNRLI